ncbi:hypothetical protein ACO0LC_25155 [Undibacterium sp. JH2W]|uniref:hypothetical protein n=1 Tax=Undibacterium sp. JH2W TaxID=3413037 RepID=UPI003BF076A9
MKPEAASRRLFGITRAKGKMYEFGLSEEQHIAIPIGTEPDSLFMLTVGTVGDVAALVNEAEQADAPMSVELTDEISFSASFFDAFLASRFSQSSSHDILLIAASAYYLAGRPGSSLVIARRLTEAGDASTIDSLLRWLLQAKWGEYSELSHPIFGRALGDIAKFIAYHFTLGNSSHQLSANLLSLRQQAYNTAPARELLLIDIISAIIRLRLAASSWNTLPKFTGIPAEQWAPVIEVS